MTDPNENIRSKEVNELIGQQPGFFIRQGSLILIAVLIVAVVISYFIRYPDVIPGTGKIICIDSPAGSRFYVELEMKPEQRSKIQNGQRVLLRYSAVAGHERADLEGTIVVAGEPCQNNTCTVKVDLKINQDSILKKGAVQADIITAKVSLWERLMEKVRRKRLVGKE